MQILHRLQAGSAQGLQVGLAQRPLELHEPEVVLVRRRGGCGPTTEIGYARERIKAPATQVEFERCIDRGHGDPARAQAREFGGIDLQPLHGAIVDRVVAPDRGRKLSARRMHPHVDAVRQRRGRGHKR